MEQNISYSRCRQSTFLFKSGRWRDHPDHQDKILLWALGDCRRFADITLAALRNLTSAIPRTHSNQPWRFQEGTLCYDAVAAHLLKLLEMRASSTLAANYHSLLARRNYRHDLHQSLVLRPSQRMSCRHRAVEPSAYPVVKQSRLSSTRERTRMVKT